MLSCEYIFFLNKEKLVYVKNFILDVLKKKKLRVYLKS